MLPMVVTPLPMIIFVALEQPVKALEPMVVTLFGITISGNLQLSNAEVPMLVSLLQNGAFVSL